MTRIDKSQLNKLIHGLLYCSVLLIFTGCKTATAPDTDATTPAEMKSDEPVEQATKSVDPKPENIATESGKKPNNTKQKSSGTTAEPGPGDGAPPREEVQEAMEKMEDSLGPLEAVPGIPEA